MHVTVFYKKATIENSQISKLKALIAKSLLDQTKQFQGHTC